MGRGTRRSWWPPPTKSGSSDDGEGVEGASISCGAPNPCHEMGSQDDWAEQDPMIGERRHSRRAWLLGAAGSVASLAFGAPEALALGRTPTGGKVAFRVPWSLASI